MFKVTVSLVSLAGALFVGGCSSAEVGVAPEAELDGTLGEKITYQTLEGWSVNASRPVVTCDSYGGVTSLRGTSTWQNVSGATQRRGGTNLLYVTSTTCLWDRNCVGLGHPGYGYCVEVPEYGSTKRCAFKAGSDSMGTFNLAAYQSASINTSLNAAQSNELVTLGLLNKANWVGSTTPCGSTTLLNPASGSLQQVNEDATQCARVVSSRAFNDCELDCADRGQFWGVDLAGTRGCYESQAHFECVSTPPGGSCYAYTWDGGQCICHP